MSPQLLQLSSTPWWFSRPKRHWLVRAPLDLVELLSIDSRRYPDGGLGFNNPIYELWEEAQDVLKYQPLRCLVSIGTGMPGVQPVGSNLKTLFETLRAIATEDPEDARKVLPVTR